MTMKMVVNFINHFNDKSLKSVSSLYIKAGFARTKRFLGLKPDRNDANGAGVKICLTFRSAYK